MPKATPTPPARTTRRRVETRQRMLDAAAAVFARQGFGRSTVEQVCSEAGYTRGAFYSNFESLDELFLAMWEQQASRQRDELVAAVTEAVQRSAGSLEAAIAHIVAATPVDESWYRISAEFSAHALRSPELRRIVAVREDRIADVLGPIFDDLLRRFGRRVSDLSELSHAVVAVHDGTLVQCLVEEPPTTAQRRRAELFTAVAYRYSEPASD
jgi:AcrR family transcriptional regulator